MTSAHQVVDLLDGVLTAAGFGPGQVSSEGLNRAGPAQVIFCADFDRLSVRFPHLPQSAEQKRGSGACVDLTLDIDANGTLRSVDLEGHSLEQTLRAVGLTGVTSDLDGAAADGGIEGVRTALALLFRGAK